MPTFNLQVNGNDHEVVADSDMPLLWVLRDRLGFTGTKYGCGIGQCGTCTVLLGDTVARACTLPVSGVAGRPVVTIEGLSANPEHRLVDAWIAEQVPQCGYCQPGQIMAAAALLIDHPQPTDAQIDRAMAGNLCRCGTYLRIRRAIHRAAGS